MYSEMLKFPDILIFKIYKIYEGKWRILKNILFIEWKLIIEQRCAKFAKVLWPYYSNSSTKRSHFLVFGGKRFLLVDAHGGCPIITLTTKKGLVIIGNDFSGVKF
jgi:hypothetical protein